MDPRSAKQKALQLFVEVVDLTAAERSAALDRACAGDAGLRAEVEALLRAERAAEAFLLRPKGPPREPSPAGPAVNDASSAAVAECAGAQIGRYKLLEKVGEGGMGTVWMAEQREPVKRRVALKIIKLGMDTRQVIARFEAERQALALMDHPHIAKVLDAGATETGRPYFVMEYIRGIPILEYCDQERLDTKARLLLFTSVCQAIQHAHQKGIIHRDIKPSNVLVTLHDGVPVPKVIDFGIAKATNSELTTKTLFTEHHQVLGTPAYMSPEQAEMSGLDIDTRSDIYSLGVLLYELLTGTTPFDTKALLESGYNEMLRAIREDEPHKPSTRVSTLGDTGMRTAQLRRVEQKKLSLLLRGDLDWIVMRSLEKDRTRRYETANGLAADIRRHLAGEAVLAAPPSAAYRLKKFVRRYSVQCGAGAAVFVAIVAGGIGTWVQYLRAEDNAKVASDRATRMADLAREKGDLAEAEKQAKIESERRRNQAEENLRLFDLLSDVVKLREAKAKELDLYPAFPEMARPMRDWLECDARPLEKRLPVVCGARDEVRRRALDTLAAASRPASSSASRVSALLPAEHRDRFLLETLDRLVTDLEAFVGEKGELGAVTKRLEEAETVAKRTIDDHKAEWDEALAAIARSDGETASTLYDHLVLKPQVGLVPIGMDKESKLWEFAHLASGEVAKKRKRDDKMLVKDETGIVFVLLPPTPPGGFWMGAQKVGQNADPQAGGNEAPVRQVPLSAFFLSKYEMTQGQWMRLSGGENPSSFPGDRPGARTTLHNPVEQVDWNDCDRCMTRHGLCLPTEAQWEYGCRARSSTPWWSGTDRESLRTPRLVANLADQAAKRAGVSWQDIADWPALDDGFVVHAPVGSFAPNPFGLYDVHGNVWEWCRDWRQPYENSVRAGDGLRSGDPSGSRVDRGGCFGLAASPARSAHRSSNPPSFLDRFLGLRPARVTTQ